MEKAKTVKSREAVRIFIVAGTCVIGYDDVKAHQYLVKSSSYKNILIQYFGRFNDNSSFTEFDIYSKGDKSVIDFNGWKITKIYTEDRYEPKYLKFEITDPTGQTDRAARIVRNTDQGPKPFIGFEYVFNNHQINMGLDLLELISKYKNWADFVTNSEACEYSFAHETDTPIPYKHTIATGHDSSTLNILS